MNYIGSKYSLLKYLEESIKKVVDDKSEIFCDLFAGTGIVGALFKKRGYKVIANDFQYYSYVLNRNIIGNHSVLSFEKLKQIIPELKTTPLEKRKNKVIDYLNDVPLVQGFIYNNYCLGGTKNSKYQRQYFSDYNGQKCDAIRQKIEFWYKNKKIIEDEYYYLLSCLLESIDKFANTASVYGAFLKKLKKTAEKNIKLKPLEIFINDKDHEVYNSDISELIKRIKGDILYLDPPYNHRQYAANYHILETIAKYDNPIVKGKTGLRNYESQKSLFCQKGKVKQAFKDLIMNAKFKYIFLSYNNEGLLSLEDIKDIMSLRGDYGYFTKKYSRFKADQDINRKYKSNTTMEYLHYVIVK